jgi:hypothetical protein
MKAAVFHAASVSLQMAPDQVLVNQRSAGAPTAGSERTKCGAALLPQFPNVAPSTSRLGCEGTPASLH